jgi:hypothetical protein
MSQYGYVRHAVCCSKFSYVIQLLGNTLYLSIFIIIFFGGFKICLSTAWQFKTQHLVCSYFLWYTFFFSGFQIGMIYYHIFFSYCLWCSTCAQYFDSFFLHLLHIFCLIVILLLPWLYTVCIFFWCTCNITDIFKNPLCHIFIQCSVILCVR